MPTKLGAVWGLNRQGAQDARSAESPREVNDLSFSQFGVLGALPVINLPNRLSTREVSL
jgi:hypothetical protein